MRMSPLKRSRAHFPFVLALSWFSIVKAHAVLPWSRSISVWQDTFGNMPCREASQRPRRAGARRYPLPAVSPLSVEPKSPRPIVQRRLRPIQGTGADMTDRHHMDHDPKTGRLRDIGDDWALLGVSDGTPQRNEYEKEKGAWHRQICQESPTACFIAAMLSLSGPSFAGNRPR